MAKFRRYTLSVQDGIESAAVGQLVVDALKEAQNLELGHEVTLTLYTERRFWQPLEVTVAHLPSCKTIRVHRPEGWTPEVKP